VDLNDELDAIADAARGHAAAGEELAAVIPAEPAEGVRVYLCAFTNGEARSWLALDGKGRPIDDRALLKDAVSIAALCELADDVAVPLEVTPRVASPAYLERHAAAGHGSSFTEAMKHGSVAVEGLTIEVEDGYKVELR
jgi:hypothetical protein